MEKHIKVYLEYYWVEQEDVICENCWLPAVDIHHILFKSHFWKKTKHLQDSIKNLIALCRNCHEKAHFRQEPYLRKDKLQELHNYNLKE